MIKRKTKRTSGEDAHPFQRLQIELAALLSKSSPGERLPSEPELARSLGVSRATLREAMRTFEGQGLIRRRQGVGTFAVGHPQIMENGLELLESIESLAGRMELEVSMGDLKITRPEADETTAASLEVPVQTPLVQIARVIQAEGRPVAYLIDILPEDILSPEELDQGFTGSVLDFLLRRGDPPLANSYTELRAVAAPSAVARLLEIQRGDVLQMFVARLFNSTGRVVDYSLSYFLPGYFRFHVVRRVAGQSL